MKSDGMSVDAETHYFRVGEIVEISGDSYKVEHVLGTVISVRPYLWYHRFLDWVRDVLNRD